MRKPDAFVQKNRVEMNLTLQIRVTISPEDDTSRKAALLREEYFVIGL